MRFLVDAQLPRRLCYRLREAGHDAVHTLDLPSANRTADAEINRVSMQQERVVITKDADFVDGLIVQGVPYKLLLISTGNIRNDVLEALLVETLAAISAGFVEHEYIELDQQAVRFHF
ncbi:MAG: putative nuclease of putative toxin-antitoxin system [Rhodothermales bacterium]|jgi:predicted nuclease of predicted toxin-antitoxin system